MATLADLLTFNLPLENTYRQAGIESPLLKTLLPVAAGAAIPGASGMRQAASRTGRRAGRRASRSFSGGFLDPDIIDKAILKKAQPKTRLGEELLRNKPGNVKQAVVHYGADIDTMAQTRKGLDEGAREALADQLQRESVGRGNTLPLWDDPFHGRSTARWELEEPENIINIPGEVAEQGMEHATAWHTPDTNRLFMSRQARQNIDPEAVRRISNTRKMLDLPENPESIGYHEGMHLAEGRPEWRHPDLDAYLNENYLQTALAPAIQGNGPPVSEYYHKPAEVLAQINQFRKWHGIEPGEEVGEDQIEQLVQRLQQQYDMIRNGFEANQYGMGTDLEHLKNLGQSYSPRKLAELIKYIPAAAGPAAGLAAQQQNR